MAVPLRQIYGLLLVLLLISGSCVSAVHGHAPEQCSHGHDHHHHHHHGGGDEHEHAPPHQCNHGDDHHRHGGGAEVNKRKLLPEELAEEEDLKLYGFGRHLHHHHHDHGHLDSELSGLGLWLHAMSCSLLVSLASLVCLIILPLIFWKGKPSKTIVDSLALFGAGAMLGDAFLHQLPHAFEKMLKLHPRPKITLALTKETLVNWSSFQDLSLPLFPIVLAMLLLFT